MIRVLGIDPGFASIGLAAIDVTPIGGGDGECVGTRATVARFEVFETSASGKKEHILKTEDNLRRAQEIAAFLRPIISGDALPGAPRVVAIAAESMSFPRSSSVAAKVALAWGVLACLAETLRVPILQASPQAVKRTVATKGATKEEIQDAMLALYPEIGALRARLTRGRWEHAHDALAVAHVMLGSDVVRAVIAARKGAA